MNILRRCVVGAAAAVLLASCGGVQVADYSGQQPALDIEQYFNGTLLAHGMFQKRGGAVGKRFTVAMQGRWEQGVGTLDEDFRYADGTRQRRTWTLRKVGPGRYEGTAADVVGKAAIEVAGNAMRLQYVLALPVDGKTYEISFDDWLYLIGDGVMLNRASMRKFGFEVGTLTVAFRKLDRPDAP
jgi:hypothetical protein